MFLLNCRQVIYYKKQYIQYREPLMNRVDVDKLPSYLPTTALSYFIKLNSRWLKKIENVSWTKKQQQTINITWLFQSYT